MGSTRLPAPSELWPTVAPDWALYGFAEFSAKTNEGLTNFCYDVYKSFFYDDRYMMYVDGIVTTLKLTFFALILGIFLGTIVAMVRVTWDKNAENMHGIGKFLLAIGNMICKLYLTIIRGTPVMVQLIIMFYVVFSDSNDKLLVGSLCFGINSGAYVAEIIRSGIMSVDVGQMEAGRSLGFGYVPTMWFVVIPQALKAVLPALANEFIVLLKETSVAAYIAMQDIIFAAFKVAGLTYSHMLPLLAAAVIYLVMVLFFTFWVNKFERRLRSSER